MKGAIISGRGRLVIGADWVVRADLKAPQRRADDATEMPDGFHQTPEGALIAGGRRIDQDAEPAAPRLEVFDTLSENGRALLRGSG